MCKVNVITSYSFIQNAKHIAEELESLINQLESRVMDIEEMNDIGDISNTLIVLNTQTVSGYSKITHTHPTSLIMNYSADKCTDRKDNDKFNNTKLPVTEKTKEYRHSCNDCGKTFESKTAMIQHITRVHRNGSKITKTKKVKKRKKLKKSIGKYDCTDCSEKQCEHRRYIDSFVSQREAGNKQIKCPDCAYVCFTKMVLISHVNRAHLKYFKFQCKYCEKLLYSRLDYKRHVWQFHTDHQSCQLCERKFAHKKNLVRHRELCRKMRPFQCDQCNVSVSSKEKLLYHKKKHTNPFSCTFCNRIFSTKGYLNHHMTSSHKAPSLKTAFYNYRCLLCNANFTNRTERALHMKEHDANEKPVCIYCKKQFNTMQDCKRHINNCKCNERAATHKCQHCSYTTTTVHNLEGHINRHHLKIAPYRCSKCEKRFTNQARLYEHSKTHLNIKTHVCTVCDSLFRGPTALKKHMRLHSGEKPYLCEICGEGFISASVRNLHVVKKHTEKTVQCPLCQSKFFTLPLMRSHVKKVHWKRKEPFDFRKLEGLSVEHYDLFRDRRMITLN